MELINLEQNTESWHESRKNIIGASDVAAILKVSEWMTPYQLWCLKKGITIKGDDKNFIFEKGHRLEAKAIVKLSFHLGIMLKAAVIKHATLPYCQVSLDGFNLEHKAQVEIKYLGKEPWLALKEHGKVPEHYLPQVMYQLIATGFEFSFFCGINDDEEITYTRIYPDPVMVEQIIKAVDQFYNKNMIGNVAPELTDLDVPTIVSSELSKAAKQHLSISNSIKSYEAQLYELENFIFDQMATPKADVDGIKLTRTINKAGHKVVKVKAPTSKE